MANNMHPAAVHSMLYRLGYTPLDPNVAYLSVNPTVYIPIYTVFNALLWGAYGLPSDH